MDVFNAFKGIADMIRGAIDETMPRQAVVSRAGATGVWVRFTPVDASKPEMWFPSDKSGLPVGTAGWVHPLAGGKGRFIADAMPLVSPHNHDDRYYTEAEVISLLNDRTVHAINPYISTADPFSTTSIDTSSPYWWDGDATGIVRQVALTPGTWQFDVTVAMKNRRSVTTGGIMLVTSIDGNVQTQLDYQTTPRDALFMTMDTRRVTVVVASARTIDIRLGFCGWSTAGTTYGYQPMLTGTYKKVI